jgi:hypothetical protein
MAKSENCRPALADGTRSLVEGTVQLRDRARRGAHLKRAILPNLALGIWLMISPFALLHWNRGALRLLWEDLLLGFGIAAFSFLRLYSRRGEEVAIADWIITALGFTTLINPFLYSYDNAHLAAWNNLAVGALVFFLAIFQDWKDADLPDWHHSRNRHHS